MKGAVLIGATSFLGRAVTARLVSEGFETHAIVRPGSDVSGLPGLAGPPLVHDGTAPSMASLMAEVGPEVVIHMAARYVRSHDTGDVDDLVRSNVLLCAQAAEAAAGAGVAGFVNTGSAFQHYESDAYRPLNLYAATKQACEDILTYYEDSGAYTVARLRLFDVYGPGDHRNNLLAAIRRAQDSAEPLPIPDEDVEIDMVFVDDAAAAVVTAARLTVSDPQRLRGTAFAIRGPRPARITEVVAAWERASGHPVPLESGGYQLPERHVRRPWSGPTVPGWAPQVKLEEGLRRVIAG